MWVDGSEQRSFVSTFVPDISLPAVVLFSPTKLRFSASSGSMSLGSLSSFLDQASSGQLATVPLSEMPSLVDGGEPPPEEEPVLEEEFNLADIMGTSVKDEAASREDEVRQVCHPDCNAFLSS